MRDQQDKNRAIADAQLNNRIFFRLFQLGNLLQRQSASVLGVTTVQWAVLGALSSERSAEGISFGELAEFLVVSRQNLDGVLKRLERDGFVERVTDTTDGRARLVRLTASGRQLWRDLESRIYDFYRQATMHFGFDDRASLVHYLNKLQTDLAKVSADVSDALDGSTVRPASRPSRPKVGADQASIEPPQKRRLARK